jgi:hypothetical protein
MVSKSSYAMTLNPLIFLFCLLTLMNILVAINGAREFNNIPLEEKEVDVGGEKIENHVDLSNNNDMEKKNVYQNQFLSPFPFPIPFPKIVIPWLPLFPFPPFPATNPVSIRN